MLRSRKIETMYSDFQSAHRKHRAWQRVVTILACFVVFCTTYALILPAITMETDEDPNAVFCSCEEHEHTLSCYSNPNADVEDAKYWERLVSELNIVGVWSRDLVNVALSQQDYHESDRNYLVLEDESRCGYTRYGAWNGDAYGSWNTAFVGWCLHYAGISEKYIPYSSDLSEWMSLLKQRGLLCEKTYTLQKGDLAFLDTDKDGRADRVGIVTECSNSGESTINLTVIEGDTDKKVSQNEYTTVKDSVCGYAQLSSAYQKYLDDNGLSGSKTYNVPIYTDKYYSDISKDDTVITIEGNLPLDARPCAYPVNVSMDGKNVVCSYDISILLSDKTVYEPDQYVTVSIKQSDIPSSSAVYYVPEKGKPEKMTSRSTNAGVAFDTGHFSIYAVVGTTPEKVENLNEKPVSDAAAGRIKNYVSDINEIRGKYYSDKITANIEKKFTGVIEDDGRLLTDKSVLYNKNDYYTFNNYLDDEFSVTLSALAQQYAQSYEVKDKAPVDVVMILDISGSMESTGTNNEKRISVATDAINYFINNLMLLHPENRVGIVVFANNSEVFLPLGRYYVGNGTPAYSDNGTIPSYIECNSGSCTVNSSTYSGISTNTALKKVSTDGKGNYVSSSAVSQVAFCDYGGTFTQSGIARAAEMFLDEKNLTYSSSAGEELKRMPVTLLLSDGEPTFCTSDYTDVLNGTLYGSGIATNTSNPQGIQGYYTILSANYYKQKITDHYQYKKENGDTVSYFYSIGMGINDTGVASAGGNTTSGDHYKRAVLNPSDEEVALLTNISASNYTVNAYQMYQLLNSTYSGSSITVGSASYDEDTSNGYTIIGTGKTPRSSVPVVDNPYSDYAYADGGFFSSEYTELQLKDVMDTILVNMINNETYVKSFPDSVSDVSFYDVIGDGMQINSDFILRYNGSDYTMSLVSSEGNVNKYQYTGTEMVYAYSGSKTAYPLSDIWVKVTTADKVQTVHWFIPAPLVPELAYYQGMNNTDYYQMFPVRLIYKVGLNDASKNMVAALKDGDSPLVFYTNAWSDKSTTVQFRANDNNPYYQNSISLTKTKENNVTGTRTTYYESQGKNDITDVLGNNGKLVFEYKTVVPDTEGELTNFKVDKIWDDGNENHSGDSIIINLFADSMFYDTATLNETKGWTHIWENIPKYYTNGEAIDYSVKEINVSGYQSVIGTPVDGSFIKNCTWNDIDSFSSGNTVRILYDNEALSNSSGSTLEMVSADDADDTQQWVLGASGSNFTLKNKSTGRYLYASRSGSSYTVSASTSTHAWNLQTSGSSLLLRSSSLNRNLRITTTGISLNSSGTAIQPQSLEEVVLNGKSVAVTNNKLEAAESTELLIEKQWLNSDGTSGNNDFHEDVNVTLYADGKEYLKVTLSDDTDWKTTIAQLPVSWSVTPGTPIDWSFKESEVPCYLSSFGDIQKTEATASVFNEKNEFTNNGVFWITDSAGNALTASDTSLTTVTKDKTNIYQQWTAVSNNGYFYLKNVGSDSYLYVTRSGSWNNYTYSLGLSSSAQRWEYNGGKLRNRSYASYYLILSGGAVGVGTSGDAVTLGQYENELVNRWYLPLTNRAGLELPATGGYVLFIYILCGLIVLTGFLICVFLFRKSIRERRFTK